MKKFLFAATVASFNIPMHFYAGSAVQLPAGEVIVLAENSTTSPELLRVLAHNAVAVTHRFAGIGLSADQITARLNLAGNRDLHYSGLEPVPTTRTPEKIRQHFGGIYPNFPQLLRFDLVEDFPILTVAGVERGAEIVIGIDEASELLKSLDEPLRLATLEVNSGQTVKLGEVIGSKAQLHHILTTYLKWHKAWSVNGSKPFAGAQPTPGTIAAVAQQLRLKPELVLGDVLAYVALNAPQQDWSKATVNSPLSKTAIKRLKRTFGVPA